MAEQQPGGGDQVAGLLDAMRQSPATGLRSPLYNWMRQRHDALAAGFDGQRVKWGPAATYLAGLGLVDGAGKPPTSETTRLTWWKVRRDVADARKQPVPALKADPARLAPSVHSLDPVLPSASRPAPPEQPPPPELARPRAKLDVRVARPLGSVAAPAAAPVPSPAPAQPGAGSDAQVSKLLAAMEARSLPIPKLVE